VESNKLSYILDSRAFKERRIIVMRFSGSWFTEAKVAEVYAVVPVVLVDLALAGTARLERVELSR
jgi:hypothetical protein